LFYPIHGNHSIGTHHCTICTACAIFRALHIRIVVTLSIHLLGHSDGVGGTIHHADLASLTPLYIYYNGSFCFCHTLLFFKSISNVIILNYLINCYWTGLPDPRIFGMKIFIPGWGGPGETGSIAPPTLGTGPFEPATHKPLILRSWCFRWSPVKWH